VTLDLVILRNTIRHLERHFVFCVLRTKWGKTST